MGRDPGLSTAAVPGGGSLRANRVHPSRTPRRDRLVPGPYQWGQSAVTREIAEVVSGVRRPNPVVNFEDGQVWVSGMNARPWILARDVTGELEAAGIEHGETTDDGAAKHGGLLIPVPGCEPISDEAYREVFGDAAEE